MVRLLEFVDAVEGLDVRAVEFSSLVAPARRAAHLAEFRSGRAQVPCCLVFGVCLQGWHRLQHCSKVCSCSCWLEPQQVCWQIPHSSQSQSCSGRLHHVLHVRAVHCKVLYQYEANMGQRSQRVGCFPEKQVLIASDAMTRGMDVEGVAQVVNYDAPVYAKTYVHRCGRTARAGRPGRAFTLLRKQVRRTGQDS